MKRDPLMRQRPKTAVAKPDPLMPAAPPKPRASTMGHPPTRSTLSKYGMTAAEWLAMCDECGNTCVVCGKPFEDRPLVIDHEHVKGFKARKKKKAKKGGHTIKVRVMTAADRRKHVRGIIHHFCNRFVRSWLTLDRARAIVKYLEAHEGRRPKPEEPA